jgi:hypothetical protein
VALTGLQRGGEFNLLEAKLTLSTGVVIDLIPGNSIMGLSLSENIESHNINGVMTIQESVNLGSTGPIIGQEYFSLKIATPGLENNEEYNIDFTDNAFMITSLQRRVDVGNGVQANILSFSSRELITNARQKVNRTLVGTYSDIVTTMLRTDLDSGKPFYVEDSVDNKKIVAPNIHPFDVIQIATKHAISKRHNDSTYIFWESMRGFNFKTLGNMYSKTPIITYQYTIPGTRYTNGKKNVELETSAIESFTITGTPNTLRNYNSGAYSSSLIVHDIISKSYQKHIYNYIDSFNNQRHIDKELARPVLNNIPLTQGGGNLSSFPSRQYLKPTVGFGNDQSYQDDSYQYNFTSERLPEAIQSRTSQMVMMDGLSLNIDVTGSTLVCAGDIIGVIIPNTAANIERNDTEDSLFKGNFLVKTLRHDFNMEMNMKRHTMSMQVVKDSMTKNISSPDNNFEPKQKSPPKTIKEFNDIGL